MTFTVQAESTVFDQLLCRCGHWVLRDHLPPDPSQESLEEKVLRTAQLICSELIKKHRDEEQRNN
jgi:hypothetical protein